MQYDTNWVFFIDDNPLAGWAHPCRFLIINSHDGTFSSSNQKFYPDSLYENFETISHIELPVGISFPPDTTLKIPMVPKNSHSYAVLISGDDRMGFWGGISMTYNTLLQIGYRKENIIVHYQDGNSLLYGNNLDGPTDPQGDINYPAFKGDIFHTLAALAGNYSIPGIPENGLGPEDVLFMYVTDHGEIVSGQSVFNLPNQQVISASELADSVMNIKCSQIIFLMDQCYSGGFGSVLTDYQNYNAKCQNRVVQTGCSASQVDYPEQYITNFRVSEFTYYWNAAVRGSYPSPEEPWFQLAKLGSLDFSLYPFNSGSNQNPHPLDYNPDTYNQVNNPFGNSDGTIQLSEAFAYADNFNTFSPPYPITQFGYFNLRDYPLTTPQQWITSGFEVDLIPNTRDNCYQGDLNTLNGLAGKIDISQTVEDRSYVIGGDLYISPGTSVHMNLSTMYMDSATTLAIQPGGNLVLDGTYFKTDNYSNEIPKYWKGIEVLGNYTLSQIPSSNQGKICLINGAKIENAMTGIFVGLPFYPSFAGGIVHCDSAYFINNIIGARFDPYQFTENSHFTSTNFVTNQTPLPNGEYPDYFVKLYGVSPISFNGCSFINTQSVINDYTKRGNGILSSDSRFLISGYCLSNEFPCVHIRQTILQNLNRGIYATNSASILTPKIDNTFFYDNVKGLYLSVRLQNNLHK